MPAKINKALLQKTNTWRRYPFSKSLISPVRFIYDKFYSILLDKKSNFNPSNTIIVTGGGRSGTTWLAEIFSSLPNYCMIFEPEMLMKHREILYAPNFVDPNDDWPEGKELFQSLIMGKNVTPHSFIRNSIMDIVNADSLVVKAMNLSKILPWLSQNLLTRGLIHIVRHPCAVYLSSKRYFRPKQFKIGIRETHYINNVLPDLSDYVYSLKKEEELFALRWCCNVHTALLHNKTESWANVSYERLVSDGFQELSRIFKIFRFTKDDMEIGSIMLKSSSSTSSRWSANHSMASTEERLGVWRKILKSEQIDNILDVIHKFHIYAFTDDIYPVF